jgi:hypothetical protein
LKLAGSNPEPAAPAVPDMPMDAEAPAAPEMPAAPEAPADDKPFDNTPFDAGVEADEETDPKKFIEQLTGKLGQSLRKYNDEQGQPDFELEKFAINSLLSATHTSEMDAEDQKDIIKKVKTAGQGDEDVAPESSEETPSDEEVPSEEPSLDELAEYTIYENMNNLFVDPKKNNMFQEGSNDILDEMKPCWKGYKQIGMKEKNGKEVPNCVPVNENMGETNNYMFWSNLKTIVHATGELMKMDSSKVDSVLDNGHGWALDHIATANDDVEEVYHFLEGQINYQGADAETMNEHEHESNNYMFWQNIKTMHHGAKEMLAMNPSEIDSILSNGHGWALDHIATSTDDVEEVYHFIETEVDSYDGETEGGYSDEYGSVQNVSINEAEYKGRTVKLGKPMHGDVKKFKVFVKNKKGKVVKVNFGDPNMEIKRDNPERRKSFRARHKCSQAKDRTTPKYWSCRMWSRKPVSKMVSEDTEKYTKELINKAHAAITKTKGKEYAPNVHELQKWVDNYLKHNSKTTNENLQESKKSSIFGKIYLKGKLNETFNQDNTMHQPEVAPVVTPTPTKPAEKPVINPKKKDAPFLPMPDVQPDPKAIKEGKFDYDTYHKTLSSALDAVRGYAGKRGYDEVEFSMNDVQHVPYGHTERFTKELTKGGVPQRKALHVQIYRMESGNYELNAYIN